jgi:hypothetical protein
MQLAARGEERVEAIKLGRELGLEIFSVSVVTNQVTSAYEVTRNEVKLTSLILIWPH